VRTLRTAKGLVVTTHMTDAEAMSKLAQIPDDFARDLVRKFHKYGLSEAQWAHVHKLVIDAGLGAGEHNGRKSAPQGSGGGRKRFFPKKKYTGRKLEDFKPVPLGDVADLFAFVVENGKGKGKRLTFRLGERPLALNVAGPEAKFPGTLNVSDGGPFLTSTWFGRVHQDGRFDTTGDCDQTVVDFLTALAADPGGVAEANLAAV
jgi:hypothetical protein